MPINYQALLKQAYHITIHNPLLWVLGLFLAGGFNGNILYFANVPLGWRDRVQVLLGDWARLLHANSSVRQIALSIILVIIIVVLVNLVKIIFVLRVSDMLNFQRRLPIAAQKELQGRVVRPVPAFGTTVKEALGFVPAVTIASAITMVMITLVLTVLTAIAQRYSGAWSSLPWVPALGLVAVVSCVMWFSLLNLFTAFFIILYRYRLIPALGLALQLIRKCWLPILETVILLMVIYGLCFFVGTALVSLVRGSGSGHAALFIRSSVLIWVWLAVVNAFFNVSLLLLFALLVKPPLYPEFLAEQWPQPAAEPSAGT